jgi:hypothetical protein
MATLSIMGQEIVITKTRDKYDYRWHATSEQPLDSIKCQEAMRLQGFDEQGYGFFDFKTNPDPTGLLHHAEWVSLTSSD